MAQKSGKQMVPAVKAESGCPSTLNRGGVVLTDSPLPRVLLFSPPYEGKVFGPPLGLLSLASSLRVAGFCPVIIDGATDPHFRDSIAREAATCFAFGVSV